MARVGRGHGHSVPRGPDPGGGVDGPSPCQAVGGCRPRGTGHGGSMPATGPHIADERTQLLGWFDLQRGSSASSARGCPRTTPTGRDPHLTADDRRRHPVPPAVGRGAVVPGGAARGAGQGRGFGAAAERLGRRRVPRRGPAAPRSCSRSTTRSAPGPTPRSPPTTSTPREHGAALGGAGHVALDAAAHARGDRLHAGHLDLIREMLDGETGYGFAAAATPSRTASSATRPQQPVCAVHARLPRRRGGWAVADNPTG